MEYYTFSLVVSKPRSLLSFRAFLAEINSTVDSEVIDGLTGLAAILHILAVVRQSEKNCCNEDILYLGLNQGCQTHFSSGATWRKIYSQVGRTGKIMVYIT